MSSTSFDVCLPDGRKVTELKVTDLKKELESRGLSKIGAKKELTTRLSAAVESDATADTSTEDLPMEDHSASVIQDQLVNETDDAVELDVPESEDEIADSSLTTVIHVPLRDRDTTQTSPQQKSPIAQVAVQAAKKAEQVKASPEHARNGERRSSGGSSSSQSKRRRQWGSGSSGMSNHGGVPAISSDSLEKLVPSLSAIVPEGPAEPPSKEKPSPHHSEHKSVKATVEVTHSPPLSMRRDSTPAVDFDSKAAVAAATRTKSPKIEKMSSSSSRKRESSKEKSHRSSPPATSRKVALAPSVSSDAPEPSGSSTKRKGPKETRAVGYQVEGPERIEACLPAKHPVTNIVHIKFLVRPFTAQQLEQMISKYGKVSELWLDRIKSTSLVRLESDDDATRCRESLDGCRWPSINPRVLRCEFASDQLYEWMKVNGDRTDCRPPRHLLTGEKPTSEEEETESMRAGKAGENLDSKCHEMKQTDLRHRLGGTGREVGAKTTLKPPETEGNMEAKKRCGEPAKLLDDLFRKTVTTPSIYWLPLSEEKAQEQASEREKRWSHRHSVSRTGEPQARATRSPFATPVTSRQASAEEKSTSDRKAEEKITAARQERMPTLRDEKPVALGGGGGEEGPDWGVREARVKKHAAESEQQPARPVNRTTSSNVQPARRRSSSNTRKEDRITLPKRSRSPKELARKRQRSTSPRSSEKRAVGDSRRHEEKIIKRNSPLNSAGHRASGEPSNRPTARRIPSRSPVGKKRRSSERESKREPEKKITSSKLSPPRHSRSPARPRPRR